MAYLVRRLLENTSNESWLRAGFIEDAAPETLLASPNVRAQEEQSEKTVRPTDKKHDLPGTAGNGHADGQPFCNEPLRDFSAADLRNHFARVIAKVSVPKVAIDATVTQAREAIEQAHEAFPAWRDTPARKRAAALVEAARIMRRRRDELAGVNHPRERQDLV